MKLDFEIGFKEKIVYVTYDGDIIVGYCLLWNQLSDAARWYRNGVSPHKERGAIYAIAYDWLIDHGYLKEENDQ